MIGSHKVGGEDVLRLVAQLHETRSREAGGTDGYEDTWALVVAWQLLRHEAVEKSGADHEGNQEARALDCDGGDGDGDGLEMVDLPGLAGGLDEVASKRRREQEGVGREDPDGGHGVDREDSGRVVSCGCETGLVSHTGSTIV